MKWMLGTTQWGVQLPSEAIHMKTAEVPDGNSLYHILIQFASAHPFPVTSHPQYTCMYYAKETVLLLKGNVFSNCWIQGEKRKPQQPNLVLFFLCLAVIDP